MRVVGLSFSALRISVVGVDQPGASPAGHQAQSFDIVAQACPDPFHSLIRKIHCAIVFKYVDQTIDDVKYRSNAESNQVCHGSFSGALT
ncbi:MULTISPECIES: hypothetical protein [Burkholderia]|uniref:hypothetical protein n=1 Tax=Burkholderia TaxID=32008 RepID=UPI0015828BFE|nr:MULTISPECIES: hypothetical protein [Burkholderia]MBN3771600.1 hypothetical protein [Burkholderia sp. Se-20378]